MSGIARGKVSMTPVVSVSHDNADADSPIYVAHNDMNNTLGGKLEYTAVDSLDKWYYNKSVDVTSSHDDLISGNFTSNSSGNQLQQIDSNFQGAVNLSDTNWEAGASPHTPTLYVIQDGTDPNGFLTPTTPWLYVIGTTGTTYEEYVTLDGSHWESDIGIGGQSMVEGRTYTFQYDISWTLTSGTIQIGLCNNSFAIQDKQNHSAASGFGTYSFEFIYDASKHEKIIISLDQNTSNADIRIDNISISNSVNKSDDVRFLFLKNSGTSDGVTSTSSDVYLTLDGGDGQSASDVIELGPKEAINLKFKASSGVDVDNLHAVTSSGTVRCEVAAIIDDGG